MTTTKTLNRIKKLKKKMAGNAFPKARKKAHSQLLKLKDRLIKKRAKYSKSAELCTWLIKKI